MAEELVTEVVYPLPTDDSDYTVVIDVKAYRKADVSTGTYIAETNNHVIQKTMTKSELNTLLYQLKPVSVP